MDAEILIVLESAFEYVIKMESPKANPNKSTIETDVSPTGSTVATTVLYSAPTAVTLVTVMLPAVVGALEKLKSMRGTWKSSPMVIVRDIAPVSSYWNSLIIIFFPSK